MSNARATHLYLLLAGGAAPHQQGVAFFRVHHAERGCDTRVGAIASDVQEGGVASCVGLKKSPVSD